MNRISGLFVVIALSLFSAIDRCEAVFYSRIVNGTQANEGEFPFMVSLRRASDGRHKCGASLINRVWALTAAHCVVKVQPEQLNIQYGSIELNATGAQLSNISKIIVHENYQPGDLHVNDIALLRLQTPIKFSSKVRPVHLPAAQQDTAEAMPAMLIGWGLNATGGIIQKQLQKVHLQIFSDDDCSQRHGVELHATNICAGLPDGGRGQCSGDSGGPLLVEGRQVGIVSWSRKPCAIPPYPGVFTEVSAYVDWMGQMMSKDRDENDWSESEESWEELSTGNLIIVSLRHRTKLQHFCAGTIIHPQWILTAAHCFMFIKDPNDVLIQYGSGELKPTDSKMVNVSEIFKHEGYSQTIAIHDIALVKLTKRLLANNTGTVQLFKEENVTQLADTKHPVLLVGWGINATNGVLQQHLQKVELNLLTLEACRQQTQSVLYSSNICADASKPGDNHGQCNGDSGGPLLLNKQQIAVVSWSLKPCGAYPGVFTNIAYYREWIKKYIEDMNL